MGNYLHSMGLDFLTEEEDTIRGVIGDTVRNGKVIYGYYHRPYINNHYGPVQIVARLGPGEKEDEMSIKGFDTHCDSMVCWKMRILQKREPKNKEDVIDKDFTLRLSDEEQREKLEEALILTCAVGLMYNRD